MSGEKACGIHLDTHSFTKALLQCYTLCAHCGHMHALTCTHTYTPTRSFGFWPVAQDTILKRSESVLPTPTVRGKDDRMATAICRVYPASQTDKNQHSIFSSHTLLFVPFTKNLIGSLLPFYFFSPLDLPSVNCSFSHWSCGEGL